ncbi:MAG: SH3 domain-containing protein [Lachnospiraceae bacterium]|nr:SH3 domain-containing protein [Lachnospiraceae bacterium]
MLCYTYTDMDATMYVQKTVNLRGMPRTDGEKLGGLSTNEEIKVTGQCVETSWYRIFIVHRIVDGYIQAATANGLVARSSVETPWKTADGKKIRAFLEH